MKPYQERVVTEKKELDEKIAKLTAFFKTQTYAEIDQAEAHRLIMQAGAMSVYSQVLGDRIAAFS